MRSVTCGECGKHYDYDKDDFCPRCGAYNSPRQQQRTLQRVDGLAESGHEGSFLHKEFHAEDRARRRTGLERKREKMPPLADRPSLQEVEGKANDLWGQVKQKLDAMNEQEKTRLIVAVVVGGIVLFSLF